MKSQNLILASFVLAVAACGPSTPAQEPYGSDPHPRPLVIHPSADEYAEMDSASRTKLKEEAETFHSTHAQSAPLAGIEALGVVDSAGSYVQCVPTPCNPAWEKLEKPVGGRALMIRSKGKLRLLTDEEFESVIGAVDTPEKAVLRTSASSENLPTTCADFAAFGGKCAAGSDESGAPVRAVDDGFDVVVFGERAVCQEHYFGDHQRAFTVVHVTRSGDVAALPDSPIGALTAAYVDHHARCAAIAPTVHP